MWKMLCKYGAPQEKLKKKKTLYGNHLKSIRTEWRQNGETAGGMLLGECFIILLSNWIHLKECCFTWFMEIDFKVKGLTHSFFEGCWNVVFAVCCDNTWIL